MSPRSASPGAAGIGTEAPVRVRFFGGLSQIGRNCAAIEAEGKLLLIDCGQMFSDDASPGVETILPDFGFLRDRAADPRARAPQAGRGEPARPLAAR